MNFIINQIKFEFYKYKIRSSRLFWPGYYKGRYNIDLPISRLLDHYLNEGWKSGFDPNPMFNTFYYLDTNPDVKKTGVNPLFHFVNGGWREFRNPCRDFHIQYYVTEYQDVAKSTLNPLYHYLKFGLLEQRACMFENWNS